MHRSYVSIRRCVDFWDLITHMTIFNGSRSKLSIDIYYNFTLFRSQILWINSHDTFDLSDTALPVSNRYSQCNAGFLFSLKILQPRL